MATHPSFSFRAYPAGLLRMSAGSLSAFLRMIVSNGSSLLTPQSIAEMRIIVGGGLIPYYIPSNSTELPPQTKFGLGWTWQTLSNGHRYFGHIGNVPGAAHLMLINEKNTISVIVLSNGDTNQPIDLSKEVSMTIENIHTTLFQCFDTNIINSSAFQTKQTFFGFFYAVLLFSHLF